MEVRASCSAFVSFRNVYNVYHILKGRTDTQFRLNNRAKLVINGRTVADEFRTGFKYWSTIVISWPVETTHRRTGRKTLVEFKLASQLPKVIPEELLLQGRLSHPSHTHKWLLLQHSSSNGLRCRTCQRVYRLRR